MAVIVFLHAHPDDESSQTAGTMARAAAEGHRVVEIFATNGDFGTPLEAADDAQEVSRSPITGARRQLRQHGCWASPGWSGSATTTPG